MQLVIVSTQSAHLESQSKQVVPEVRVPVGQVSTQPFLYNNLIPVQDFQDVGDPMLQLKQGATQLVHSFTTGV